MLDLKDAYLSVPMSPVYTHLLRFQWQNQTYQFNTLAFGLSSAPYVFTKLLKPAMVILIRLGIRVVLYLDNMLHSRLQGGSPTPSSNSNASPDSTRIYPQSRVFDTHSEGGFLGILLGLLYVANLITKVQNPVRVVRDR